MNTVDYIPLSTMAKKPGKIATPGKEPGTILREKPEPGIRPKKEPGIQPEREPLTILPAAPPKIPQRA